MTDDPTAGSEPIRAQLRAALTAAMKAREMVAVSALRSVLGAIDNAEAVDSQAAPSPSDGSPIAGAVAGAGSTEVRRRTLSENDVAAVIRVEINDRTDAANIYRSVGSVESIERADLLEAEARLLSRFIPRQPPD